MLHKAVELLKLIIISQGVGFKSNRFNLILFRLDSIWVLEAKYRLINKRMILS